MLHEFFLKRAVRVFGQHGSGAWQLAVAWGGLAIVLAHACIHGWIKYQVNAWYRSFYDLLETAGSLASDANTTVGDWENKQEEVMSQLGDFSKIALVSVIVMPVAKFFRSAWALQWRLALMRVYVNLWNANRPHIEGASQRVHEDSYKFSKGVELCLTTVLDSLITLGVFVPVLTELGRETPCPQSMSAFAWLGEGWLVGTAVASALVGFAVTMLLGQKLVRLEVENQVVEAKLRRDLVMLETSPATICHVHAPPAPSDDGAITPASLETVHVPSFMPPLPHFLPLFDQIQRNYNNLFLNFGILNLWLALFDQFNIILPYLVFAPLLFHADPDQRIKLGTLVQVSNSFDKVFGSLSIVAENWAAVNEFRSVLRRLRQYERNVYYGIPHPSRRSERGFFKRTVRSSTRARALFGPPEETTAVLPDASVVELSRT